MIKNSYPKLHSIRFKQLENVILPDMIEAKPPLDLYKAMEEAVDMKLEKFVLVGWTKENTWFFKTTYIKDADKVMCLQTAIHAIIRNQF
jgi:hypothetical protein